MKSTLTILIIFFTALLSHNSSAQGLANIDSTSSGDVIFGPKWFHDSVGLYALRGGLGASQLLTTDSLGRLVLVNTTGLCAYACDTNNTMATIFYADSLVSATMGSGSNWLLTGNAGTSSSANFIGTTDNKDLVFRINNISSGLLDDINYNTAFGYNSLSNNGSGTNNLANGSYALYNNTSGANNSAQGEAALVGNTSGSSNTALGNGALQNNATGSGLTGLGAYSNVLNYNFSNATAIGANSLVGESNSVSIGDTTQPLMIGAGTAYPIAALDVRVTRNSGHIPAGLFTGGNVGIATYTPQATLQIGDSLTGVATLRYIDGNQGAGKVLTSDSQGNGTWQTTISPLTLTSDTLSVKVNNTVTELLDNSLSNYSIGALSLDSITTGSGNQAIGNHALAANTSGRYNLAFGDYALSYDTAGNNIAMGNATLKNNISGIFNVAIGRYTLLNNTTGDANVGVGGIMTTDNTGEYDNSTQGYGNFVATLRSNTTGSANTAIGASALSENSSGNANTALGVLSMISNSTGSSNTAIGASALGTGPVANTAGSLLTAIGSGTGTITDSLVNSTIIGANAMIGQSNSVSIGDTSQPLFVGVGTCYPSAALDIRVTTASGSVPSGLFNGGSVGIGTYSPIAMLDVRGETNAALYVTKPIPVAINSSATASAAQVASGYITSTSISTTTITLPNASVLGAYLNATQGTTFDLYIDNTAGANEVTLAFGSGFNTLGFLWRSTIDPSTSTGVGIFRIVFTSGSTAVITRLG